MTETETNKGSLEPDDSANAATLPARTGVMIGILVAVILALAVYFFWRGTGWRDDEGRRPAPPPREALP